MQNTTSMVFLFYARESRKYRIGNHTQKRRSIENGGNGESLSWAFPGGKIETDETPFIAVEREVYEETGHYVEAGETLDERQHPSFPVHIRYIACKLSERNPDQVNDSGVVQTKWIQIAKLGSYLTSSLNENVKSYLAR